MAQTPTSSSFCSFPFGRMDAAGCQNLTTLPADSFSQTNQLRAAAHQAAAAAEARQTFIYFYLRVEASAPRALILSRTPHNVCVHILIYSRGSFLRRKVHKSWHFLVRGPCCAPASWCAQPQRFLLLYGNLDAAAAVRGD